MKINLPEMDVMAKAKTTNLNLSKNLHSSIFEFDLLFYVLTP
jgi:hypothetical protein